MSGESPIPVEYLHVQSIHEDLRGSMPIDAVIGERGLYGGGPHRIIGHAMSDVAQVADRAGGAGRKDAVGEGDAAGRDADHAVLFPKQKIHARLLVVQYRARGRGAVRGELRVLLGSRGAA